MATMQILFRENWPMGGRVHRPGEILFEAPCLIDGATPGKIENAISLGAVTIRLIEEAKPETAEPAPRAKRKK